VARAHPSYVVECFFKDPAAVDGFRLEKRPIKAWSDEQAKIEAASALRGTPDFYKITAETRSEKRVIFDSRKVANATRS